MFNFFIKIYLIFILKLYRRAIIYYGTRTHKQIEQVVKEYKRLPFGVDATLKYIFIFYIINDYVFRHTILASRDHGCVNPIAKNKSDITEYCKELLSNEGVFFFML